MDFLQELGSHRGGLLLLKTELFWYGGRGWDGVHDRVCLLMDSAPAEDADKDTVIVLDAAPAAHAAGAAYDYAGAALLLIDGCPHWVWVSSDDLELLQPGCNPCAGVVGCIHNGGSNELLQLHHPHPRCAGSDR